MRRRSYVMAMICGLGIVAGSATPAHAAKWYSYPDWCGVLNSVNCTLQYTGGWPDGQVRGQGQGGLFAIKLYTKTSASGAWKVAKATYPLQGGPTTTPATKVGKSNWYRVCVFATENSQPSMSNCGASVYLGD